MAEWGKGDPRWIVEDRPDATNPNNWHWIEKDATQWSKTKLNQLLVGLKMENDEFQCQIKEVKKCEGEASASNRKAKLVLLYEWNIEGVWEGSSRTGDNRTTYQGTFNIPNLSEENEIHEVTMTFSADKSKGDKVKEMMRKDGQAVIREQLGRYVASLKEEFSQGLILPTKSTVSTAAVPPPPTSTPKGTPSTPTSIQSTKNNQPGPLETQDVKIQETFSCSKVDLFRTFCDIDRVKAFTHNSVSHYDCKQGGFFSLLSDNITGRFLKIEPYDRIDMLWRFKSWPSDHHSHVSLLFQEKAGQTKLIVQQTGVPAQYYENTRDGWKRFYLDSIKSTFGYGSRLF